MCGKIYNKRLIEDILSVVDNCKERISWLFFEDVCFSPICFSLVDELIMIKEKGYFHRVFHESLSNGKTIKPYHYETADTSDFVLEYALVGNNATLYKGYMESSLANLQSIWYKIDHFELNKEIANAGKMRIKVFYNKYYKTYMSMNKTNVVSVTIFLFYKIHWLWKLTVEKLYFAKKYK